MKRVGLFLHGDRREAVEIGRRLARALSRHGIEVEALASDAERLDSDEVSTAPAFPEGLDLVFVLGGDGTLLRAAQLVYRTGVPLLGVNLGHLGFLSSLEPGDLDPGIERILRDGVEIEERLVIEGDVRSGGATSPIWALNDVIIEKHSVGRAIKLAVEIGGEPFMSWATDGLIVATSTGATAYSFSAGGPVVSPAIDCFVVTPVAPHSLFARTLIVPPTEEVVVRMLPDPDVASMSADGRPPVPLSSDATLHLRAGGSKIRLARVDHAPFWRLFRTKFGLPEVPRTDLA